MRDDSRLCSGIQKPKKYVNLRKSKTVASLKVLFIGPDNLWGQDYIQPTSQNRLISFNEFGVDRQWQLARKQVWSWMSNDIVNDFKHSVNVMRTLNKAWSV